MFALWISISTLSLFWSTGGWNSGAATDDKAAGNVSFWVGPAKAKATFQAREHWSNPSGAFVYKNVTPTGYFRTFRLRFTKVKIQGDEGTFDGHVDFSNIPGWSGRWVKVWVRDRATPGAATQGASDQITFRFANTELAATQLQPLVFFPVTAGDLQVQD
jgi:hypothetical protein